MATCLNSYVMGIGEAEAFSERLKRELQALEAANVHAILETEPMIDEVYSSYWVYDILVCCTCTYATSTQNFRLDWWE